MAVQQSLSLTCILVFLVTFMSAGTCTAQTSNVTAIISMGDSLIDCGNNNDLNVTFSIARANHTPYGRDFDTHEATGRFSNGRIIPDLIAAKLGLSFALAFRDPNATGEVLKRGINLASGGAGILDSTSNILTPHNLTEQLSWLANYTQRLKALEGTPNATTRLANALFIMSAGSNDFSYRNVNTQVSGLTDSEFLDLLTATLKGVLQAVYNAGIRKFVVSAIGPLGCTPVALTFKCGFNSTCRQECNEESNNLAYAFDLRLKDMLTGLQANLTGSRFYFNFDAYNITYDAIKHPGNYGLATVDRGCCGMGYTEIGDGCNIFAFGTCLDASKYLFFDAIHPGEHFTNILANRTFDQLQSS